jgi:DNA-binding MarR family transcriptional regulator
MRDSILIAAQPVEVAEKLRAMADFRYRLRRFAGFSEAVSEAAGVTGQQYQMLQVVATADDGVRATISYLAERMVLRHNSAVELVDRAERAGLVRRVADASDLRRSVVEMTERGRDVLLRLAEEHLQELRRLGPEMALALATVVSGPETTAETGPLEGALIEVER